MKLKGTELYYALLCDCSAKGRSYMLLCGVYSSKIEAEDANKEVKGCPARHYIKKVIVTVEWNDKQRQTKERTKRGTKPKSR